MGSSDRREAFATCPAAVAKDSPAALARVAAQETVLAFAPDLRGLILSLHKSKFLCKPIRHSRFGLASPEET
jgi:hypothetical protein